MQFITCTALLCRHVHKLNLNQNNCRFILRIMKMVAFILLVFCLQLSANTTAQDKITMREKGASLLKIFTEIQKQTGYSFFLTEETIKEYRPIDIEVQNASLKQVLDLCFKDQPFTYTINRNTITVTPKKKERMILEERVPEINPVDVTGKVLDNDGVPLSGATIAIKGTNRTTITNSKGEFSIKDLNNDAVLVVSSIGYETEIINLNGRTTINITLKIKVVGMDEVQVIGYGTVIKRLNTGNVASVKAADIEKQPVQNPLLALQGRVPGLFITQNSGLSGSSIKVRIQGKNSILNGNNPLYVIDGVPIVSELPMTGIDWILGPTGPNYSGNGNALNYISTSDIESIDILKDADATAIYGSRGANGAILITTKKGKAGPMRFDLNMQRGFGDVSRKLKMLNTREYLDMRYEAFHNDNIDWKSQSTSANDLKVWDTTRYTDWQKELIGKTANYTNIKANLSGGTNNLRYLIGSSYHRETTVFPISKDFGNAKGTVHFALNANGSDQKFNVQFSGSYIYDKNLLPRTDLTQAAIMLEPHAPEFYNSDGSINWAPDAAGISTYSSNPILGIYNKYENKTFNLISNIVLGYKILPELEVSSSLGYNNMLTNDVSISPLIAVAPENRSVTQRMAAYGERKINSWVIEPLVKYTKTIRGGKLDVLIGGTILNNKANSGYLFGTGYLSDEMLEDIHSASNVRTGVSSISEYKYGAIFSRVNYDWQNKYIINFTARRDGSTRFGEANRFHSFGSVGAAWLFSNEKYIKDNWFFLSFGKLKGSYGITGSDQIGDYNFMSLYNLYPGASVPYQGTISLIPSGLPNPKLQWEETRKLQVGIELGFFQNRILANATYAKNRSSKQLLRYALPSVSGFLSYLSNFPATIQNRNWEFSINSINIKEKNFIWTTNLNLTIPQNKLIAFPNLSSSTYSNLLVIGQSITINRALKFIGVDPTTGNYMYWSKTNTFDPKYPDDYTELVSTDPKYYGGIQNTVSFKGVELDFLFQFVKQLGFNDELFWNGNGYPGNFYGGWSNQPTSVLNRWKKQGDVSSFKKFSTYQDPYVVSSDYRITDASYIRVKNVSLSWEIKNNWTSKFHLRNCRAYVQGQNLLTITKYKGLDPENQSISTPSLPPLRVWIMGLQIGL
jgi:TonB-dependent starch-binding outer membrane protein SusC